MCFYYLLHNCFVAQKILLHKYSIFYYYFQVCPKYMVVVQNFILHFNIITTSFLDENIAVKVDFSAIAFNNMQYAPHLKVKYRGTLTSFKKIYI